MKNCAYSRIAFDALIKMNNYSEKEAREAVETLNYYELVKKAPEPFYLTLHGVMSVAGSIGLDSTETKQFFEEIIGESTEANITEDVRERLSYVTKMQNGIELIDKMTMDALTAIHDMSVFHTVQTHREAYKHLPIETQGWHEAKNGLMYVAPIMESIGVKIDEESLRKEYTRRAIERLSDLDLKGAILSGFDGYDKNWSSGFTFFDSSYVEDVVLPDIETKGFGKDEILMAALDARGTNPIKAKSDIELELDPPGNR
jgi:hypothetical protein